MAWSTFGIEPHGHGMDLIPKPKSNLRYGYQSACRVADDPIWIEFGSIVAMNVRQFQAVRDFVARPVQQTVDLARDTFEQRPSVPMLWRDRDPLDGLLRRHGIS